MNQYEAMLLFDPTFGASFENCEAEVRRLMERAGAEIILCRKWDERRLAYAINGRKRGVYVLVYFKASGDRIASLERDVQISENVLRILAVRADGLTPEMMEQSASARGSESAGPAESVPDRGQKPAVLPDESKGKIGSGDEVLSDVSGDGPVATAESPAAADKPSL